VLTLKKEENYSLNIMLMQPIKSSFHFF